MSEPLKLFHLDDKTRMRRDEAPTKPEKPADPEPAKDEAPADPKPPAADAPAPEPEPADEKADKKSLKGGK